jgi:energy-converting hydrogenase A subunit R
VKNTERAFISDCEGPISINDNAFEITSHFVPEGDRLFTVISRYDDVLAYVLKKPKYKAGDTLKLILPFLKAYNVTDHLMREYSAQNVVLIQNAKDTLQFIRNLTNAFLVSTSYEHYVKTLCQALDFPYKNTYCTQLSIDKYHITEKEKTELKKFARQIAEMPIIEIPSDAESLDDFSEKHRKAIQRLDEIFWRELANMKCGKIFREVNPAGGKEKAEAVKDAAQKLGIELANVMYVGDSITDVEAFRLVRENRGLAVSFNGNRYAVRNAEIAVLSENSVVTAILADVFFRYGKRQLLGLVKNWNLKALKKSPVNPALLKSVFQLYPESLPKAKRITGENMEVLAEESTGFRKKVRGEAIGRLG